MAVCKKYSNAVKELTNQCAEGKLSPIDYAEKLIEYSDGDAPICVECGKKEDCFKDVNG